MLLQITEPDDLDTGDGASLAIGIDLGTTHSVVAYVEADIVNGHIVKTLTIGESPLVPSIVSMSGEHVGTAALHTEAPFRSTKRLFDYPEKPICTTDKTPVMVAARILYFLREQAENALNQSITQAVITVPAYFDEPARQATKKAAAMAGLDVLRLISEPTAAALAYGLEHKREGLYAIYDLGGGTFDFSLLRLQDSVFQVLATGGDTHLGGDDIDEAILKLWQIHKDDFPQWIHIARKAKEQLSQHDSVTLENFTLTRDQLGTLAQPFISKTLHICDNVLRDAGISTDELDGIVLVGGSTRLHTIQSTLTTFFKKPPLTNINPDEVVAHGAALQAHALTKGANTLLLDVTPLSLGVETMGGLFEKIIPRNTPIPCHLAQDFTTYVDDQDAMSIHILQGEKDMIGDCRSLGTFTLTGIPPMPSGTARIRVSFHLDADGILMVSAQEQTTGIQQTITLNPAQDLNEDGMKKLLTG